jgi:predicted metal-dependent phosphoesterase TrpH
MSAASPEAIARHPHLSAAQVQGRVRVDLHTHTMWSGDSTTTPAEFAAAVVWSGLDVVCITDHNAIEGARELRDRVGCRVIVGEELRTAAGEVIGLFLTERVPMGISHLDAARAIRDQGGVVYIPHPFDPMRRNLNESALYELAEADLIDAVEVLNAKTSLASLNRRAAEFAVEFGIVGGAGSDGHVPDALGAAYVEMADFDGPMEFLASLATADVIGHHWDEPRPWSPRIVPSITSG